MTDPSRSASELAHDTRVLPWTALTSEEQEIIENLNDLLRAVVADNQRQKGTSKPSDRCGSEHPRDPWALPEKDRRSRVFMIDGPRGAGKTSLLLTMITGWRNPEDKDVGNEAFKGMDKIRHYRI